MGRYDDLLHWLDEKHERLFVARCADRALSLAVDGGIPYRVEMWLAVELAKRMAAGEVREDLAEKIRAGVRRVEGRARQDGDLLFVCAAGAAGSSVASVCHADITIIYCRHIASAVAARGSHPANGPDHIVSTGEALRIERAAHLKILEELYADQSREEEMQRQEAASLSLWQAETSDPLFEETTP